MLDSIIIFLNNLWYVWIVVIAALIYFIIKPKIRGYAKRANIKIVLSSLPEDKYILLKNIMLKNENRMIIVDYILVSVYGLFIISANDYEGVISGKENDEFWYNLFHGKRNKIKNPIIECTDFIKEISVLCDYGTQHIIPIIAFSNKCILHAKSKTKVIYYSQINKILKKQAFEEVMSFEQAKKISRIITDAGVNLKESKKRPAAEIFNKINEKKDV